MWGKKKNIKTIKYKQQQRAKRIIFFIIKKCYRLTYIIIHKRELVL